MKMSKEQAKINLELAKLKKWWIENYPICIFCLHLCTEKQINNKEVDLCHKIRRSDTASGYTRFELQTLKLNTGLGHRICHDIFDNNLQEAVKLPGFNQVMNDIFTISPEIYNRLMILYSKYL